jgi:hypothetical protein
MLRGIYCLGLRYRGGQGSIIRESDCALRDTSAGSMVVLWRYQAMLTLACEKGGGCAFVPDGSRDHLRVEVVCLRLVQVTQGLRAMGESFLRVIMHEYAFSNRIGVGDSR